MATRHSKQRAEERYGLTLSRAREKQIIRAIHTGKANLLHKLGGNGSVLMVHTRDATFFVLFDFRTDTIVTLLPPDNYRYLE